MHTVTGSIKLHNAMHRMGAQVHGLGANESTCTPLATPLIYMDRGVRRWFGKGGLYRSIGKDSMISVHKMESSYVTIRKHRGAPAPGAPMVPTPMK